jgi:hypothetical protein
MKSENLKGRYDLRVPGRQHLERNVKMNHAEIGCGFELDS